MRPNLKDIHFMRLLVGSSHLFLAKRHHTTSEGTVMRKREKRTGTWRGLGNWLSLEIDDRAHDVRTSGDRQKSNTTMRNSVCKIGQGTAQRG
jgi:hypothetical protein